MNHTLLLLIFLFNTFAASLHAQTPKSFPVDDDAAFANALGAYIATSSRPEAKELGLWIQRSFLMRPTSPEEMTAIKTTANLLLSKKVPLWPQFYNYARLMMQVQTTDLDPAIIAKNFSILQKMLNSESAESLKQFHTYVEYLNNHYKDKTLFSDKAKTWKIENGYALDEENGQPVMLVVKDNLTGFNNADTMVIRETSGKFYPMTNQWKGVSGTISWRRVGFPEDKVYASFGEYEMNLSKPELSIDTVTFTFQPYTDLRIKGKFRDALNNSRAVAITYPQFQSFDAVSIRGLSQELKFESGVQLEGGKIYASGFRAQPARLIIMDKRGEKIVEAESNRFLISNMQQVDGENTKVSFFFMDPGRPIRHPSLTFSYSIPKRQVKMTRENNVEAKIPFMSEFFMMNFLVDQVVWNIDSNYADLNSLSVNAQLPTIFESYSYYVEGIENKYRQFLDFDPLMIIQKYCESMETRVIDADDLAGMMRAKDAATIEKFLYKMMEDGYIYYDRSTGIVTVFDKLILHAQASQGGVDYDNIRFSSQARGKIGKILFEKRQIEVYGVDKLKISNSKNMIVTPTSDTVYIGENRSLTMKGVLTAGKVNFYAKNLQFNYDDFLFVMDNIDSMLIMVPTGEKDKYGNIYLTEINTPIQSISGKLYIDDPSNRSGKKNYPRYPYFVCNDSSYVYYDQGKKGDHYKKDDFYFLVYPFEFDSMSTFETEALRFKGQFVSGGIFPKYEAEIGITKNLTLGFEMETPTAGLDMFSQKGNFRGKLILDSDGLRAQGVITKKSLEWQTDKADFFPDSIYAEVSAWSGKQDKQADLPEIQGGPATFNWNPGNDSIHLLPQGALSVKVYNGTMDLLGEQYIIKNNVLYSKGEFDVADGHFKSDDIRLGATQSVSPKADMEVKSKMGNEKLFSAERVKVTLDFETKIADVIAPDSAGIAFIFATQLNTNTKIYNWDFGNNLFTFKNPGTDKKQVFELQERMLKGLSFTASESVLNLTDKSLKATGVSQINVADSKVIPAGSQLVVKEDGTISKLEGATVIFNADSAYHIITEATVDIQSQNKMSGFGKLTFESGGQKREVRVEDFSTSIMTIEPEKGKGKETITRHYVKARGIIPEEENYYLDKRVQYKGNLLFSSLSKKITLDGYARLELNSNPGTEWFKITQDIDFRRAYFTIDSLQNEFRQPIQTGLALDMTEFIIYPLIIQSKLNRADRMIFNAKGFVKFVPDNAFAFGTQEVLEKPVPFAEIMKYDDATGLMDIYGNFNLTEGIEPARVNLYGASKFRHGDSSTFQIQGTAAFDFYLSPEFTDLLGRMMLDYNASANILQLANNKIYSAAISNLIPNANTAAGVANDMERFNNLSLPLDFGYNIVISDLKFFYDQMDGTFKSLNPGSLLVFMGKPIVQKINCFVEIGPRQGKDFINIYLQTTSGEWFFFRYTGGELSIITSDDRFNSMLSSTKPERRMLTAGKQKIYQFMPASVPLKDNFIARMEEFRERLLNP
jgi:hypothetical protein